MIKDILKPINLHIRYRKIDEEIESITIRDSSKFGEVWRCEAPNTLFGLFKEIYGDSVMDLYQSETKLPGIFKNIK